MSTVKFEALGTANSYLSNAALPTVDELLQVIQELAYIAETVAHLKNKERDILPLTDKAREYIDAFTGLDS